MAQRDRTQGYGFVYVDIAKLKAHREQIVQPESSKAINLNRDPRPTETEQPSQVVQRTNAIGQIRENLDRLQALHHKLHVMLEELNHVTKSKKKN